VGKFSSRLVDWKRTKEEHWNLPFKPEMPMPAHPQPHPPDDSGLEAAVDQAIAACGGDLRATIRALIAANNYLENEVAELMKAVSHAYTRGRFHTYAG
jgi:hypothetical protein